MPPVIATLRPSFVRIFYHSVLAAHVMNVGTRQWNTDLGTNGKGGYMNWEDVEVDADDMIQDIAQSFQDLMPTTGAIDSYLIMNYPTAENIYVPVASGSIALTGTDATPGQNAAVQKTFNFYDSAFNTARIVLLDCASDDTWTRKNPGQLNAFESDLVTRLTDVDWAWQSRKGFRPNQIRGVTTTLNDRLRRNYNYG